MFIINPYVFSSLDPDAAAFIAALGTLDATEQGAINQLVLDLKAASIWAKFYALYPFIGGTAADHKWNLIDPRDLDAAFRLTFHGTVTHDANGITGNGTTGYANTYLNGSTVLTLDNTSYSQYVHTDVVNFASDFGANDTTNRWQFHSRFTGDTLYSDQYNTGTGRLGIFHGSSLALMTASRTSSTSHAVYQRTTQLGSNATTGGSLPNLNIFLLAENLSGSASGFSDRCFSLASIQDGFNSTEVTDYYNAVQTYQTTLGRNV